MADNLSLQSETLDEIGSELKKAYSTWAQPSYARNRQRYDKRDPATS